MKICIIGTHSTGKTTLVNALSDFYKKLGKKTMTISEISRLCPYPINEDTNIDAQKWILREQMKYEDISHQNDNWVFCDRGTIDNFAYLERTSGDEDISEIKKDAIDHMKTYDLVFKTIKLTKPAQDDGVRSVDDEFRDDIDGRVVRLLDEEGIDHVLLPESLEVDVHVDFIAKKVKKNLIKINV